MRKENSKLKAYGSDRINDLPEHDRRWFVKVFSRGSVVRYVQAICSDLPKLPAQGWLPPAVRPLKELQKYLQLTEQIESALLFTHPNDALNEVMKLEEFDLSAICSEFDQFTEETEKIARSLPLSGLNQWRLCK